MPPRPAPRAEENKQSMGRWEKGCIKLDNLKPIDTQAERAKLGLKRAEVLKPLAEENKTATSKNAPRNEKGQLQPVC